MQTYIQRNRAKKRKNIYSIFSSSCIYLYLFIIKFLFCLVGFVNSTFPDCYVNSCSWNTEEDDERERQMLKKTVRERKTGDTEIQQTECTSLQKILEYLNDHVSERSRRQNTTFSEPVWRRVDSELNSPSKWGEQTTAPPLPPQPHCTDALLLGKAN